MKTLSLLQNKQVMVLGAGLSGLSCARFLQRHNVHFVLNDNRSHSLDVVAFNQDFPDTSVCLGYWQTAWLRMADIILVSPGIDLATPELRDNISDDCQIWGDVELYCRLVAEQTEPSPKVLAVTGSNGKSTVVSLLHFWAERLGLSAQLAGNIGQPVLDYFHEQPEYLILELSSFQLETISSMSPAVACVLNVSDDHLDRHGDLATYQQIKQKVYHNSDVVIFNRDDRATWLSGTKSNSTSYSFGAEQASGNDFGLMFNQQDKKYYLMQGDKALLDTEQLTITGRHNALNCLAALALASNIGWPLMQLVALLPEFEGLAHRCQRVPSSDGIIWINDSKATNVGATEAALLGLANDEQQHNLYLIAGGVGKGADFSPLKDLLNNKVSAVFTFGQDGDAIAALTDKACSVQSLQEAVKMAAQQAQTGDTVLLSPACASLDMFDNYIQRGQAFVDAVKEVNQC